MSPKSPTAPACSESELICLVGFCHPNRHGGGRHTAPTFPPLKTLLSQPPWLLSLLTKGPVQRPGTCRCLCWDAQLLCPQMPRVRTSKILHCLVGGRWGGCSNQPHARIWIPLLFPPFHKGVGERRRRETPLKNVSRAIRSAVHLAAEPSDTPMARLSAARQLFSLL